MYFFSVVLFLSHSDSVSDSRGLAWIWTTVTEYIPLYYVWLPIQPWSRFIRMPSHHIDGAAHIRFWTIESKFGWSQHSRSKQQCELKIRTNIKKNRKNKPSKTPANNAHRNWNHLFWLMAFAVCALALLSRINRWAKKKIKSVQNWRWSGDAYANYTQLSIQPRWAGYVLLLVLWTPVFFFIYLFIFG